MIKAVFFDFFNTLAYYEPPREQIYIGVCEKHGIHVEGKALAKSLPLADMFWRDENRRNPVDKRTEDEKVAFWSEYVIRILKGAGIDINRDTAFTIFSQMRQVKFEFKAFPDVTPTLKLLKNRSLILGLISNVGQDMQKAYKELGIEPYLDHYVTSFEVGCDKPQPEIFLAALQKAKVKPEETLFIGDQYDIDIVGAFGVGMKAILIDRKGWSTDITDCPRIENLDEIVKYI